MQYGYFDGVPHHEIALLLVFCDQAICYRNTFLCEKKHEKFVLGAINFLLGQPVGTTKFCQVASTVCRSIMRLQSFDIYSLRGVYAFCMNRKPPINVYLPANLDAVIALVSELGISLSAVARIALKKYKTENLSKLEDGASGKLRRTILHLDNDADTILTAIANREKMNRSEVLRRVLIRYFDDHRQIFKMLV